MGFVILPALVADIPEVYDAYFAAFKDNAVTRAFFPSATKEDMTNPNSEFRKLHTAHVFDYWQKDSTQYTLKCVDSETGKVVGMALWDIYLTPSAWRKPEISWLEGKDRERAEALVSPLWSAREKMWLDQKYLYCHVIAVRPDYQRKGVGQLLMKYGISVAQQAELPIYIESSKEAVKLYEKMGCRRLKERVEHEADHMSTGDATGTAEDRTVELFVWVPQAGEEKLPKSIELV